MRGVRIGLLTFTALAACSTKTTTDSDAPDTSDQGEASGDGGDDGGGDDGGLPTDLSSYGQVAIWLDATELTGLADGDAVSVLPDRSGNGLDVVQSDATFQPVFRTTGLSGLPAVEFDGDGMQTTTDFGLTGDAAFTAILVAHLPAAAGSYPLGWAWGDCSISSGCASLQNKGNTLALATGWFQDADTPAGAYDAHWGQPTVITISKDAGSIGDTRIFFDGVEQTVTGVAVTPDFTSAPFQVGSWNLTQPMRMDLGELVIYGEALSDDNRSAAECSLAERWGLTVQPTVDCA